MAANGDLSQAENSTSDHGKNSPNPNMQQASKLPQYGRIKLDISNSVLPLEKLNNTPSGKDGLSEDMEQQVRSFGCELIQLGGKLLRLPQVNNSCSYAILSNASIIIIFVLYLRLQWPLDVCSSNVFTMPKVWFAFHSTMFLWLVYVLLAKLKRRQGGYEILSMCFITLSKSEAQSKSIKLKMKKVASFTKYFSSFFRKITPVVLDHNYLALKNNVIKAERRVLKELGFCVHVKHPHKVLKYLRSK